MDVQKGRLGHISTKDTSEDLYAMTEGEITNNGDKTPTRLMTRTETEISIILLK